MSKVNKPLVTIVTVTYNAEDFLEKTIKSVIEQTYQNIEYIIIDGNSNDETVNIIKEYSENISYWISEPDNGIFDAMNKSIKIAKGTWINFLNAGDTYLNQFIISDIFFSKENKTDIILSHTNIIDEETKKSSIFYADLSKIYETTPCFHQAQFVKSSILKKNRYNLDYKIVCDYDLMIYCFRESFNFQIIDMVSVNFLAGGFSSDNSQEAMLEGMIVLKKYGIDYKTISKSKWMEGLVRKKIIDVGNIHFSSQFNSYVEQIQLIAKNYEKIGLYGYGRVGKNVKMILGNKVSAIYDRSFSCTFDELYYSPSEMNNSQFDIIVICVLGREKEISQYLIHNMKIEESSIFSFKL